MSDALMNIPNLGLLSLLSGLIALVCGILLFFGVTKWGKRNYKIGKFELTYEAAGFLLFLLGILLMLMYLIPLLSPRFISPGMA
jgi:vacuolar-type H+-ATPase subunit I/STV1